MTLAAALAAAIGRGKVLADPAALEEHGRDESGLPSYPPQAVAFAESTSDVQAVLRVAAELGVPVTPAGARTGKSGGSLPIHGGIALSLARMDRILSVSPADLTAVVQPGVITGRLMEEVEARGLFYPPDPNSWETCTIGGNVAENAGGPRALKYGVTGHYVLGLEAVLPSGEVVRTGRRTIKGVAGYDLTSLLVGSEGTLAVITEITLRLLPLPREIRTALCIFPGVPEAARAVGAVLGSGLLPRTLEFFDELAIEASNLGGPFRFPPGSRAAVLAETDGDDADAVMAALVRLGGIAQEQGAIEVLVASTESQRRDLWATRRQVSVVLRKLHPRKLSEDVVVPRSRIPEAVERMRALGEKHGLDVSTYGHAGDGNLHANVLFDTDADRPRVDACIDDIVRTALELGGTITGEHGVGLAKRDHLAWEQGEALIALQRRLKETFDPRGLLNPGKILPLRP